MSKLQFIADRVKELKDVISKTSWNINSEIVSDNIGDAPNIGRSGLSYFVNAIPMKQEESNVSSFIEFHHL